MKSEKKEIIGYRVRRCLTDNQGNVVHEIPVGFSKTLKGARALQTGCGILPTRIEEVYKT